MALLEVIEIFSATKARDRAELGKKATAWIANHKDLIVVDKIVTQSSDNEFHCLTITLFCSRKRQREHRPQQTG